MFERQLGSTAFVLLTRVETVYDELGRAGGGLAAQGEAYWRVHVEAWRSSGQSRGEYCALHGLSRKTFGWWAWRLPAARQQPGQDGPRQSELTGPVDEGSVAHLVEPFAKRTWDLLC